MAFKITERDVFAAKLAAKPIDIRKVKTEQEWEDTVRLLESLGVLTITEKKGILRVEYPITGIAQATPDHRRPRAVTLQVGHFVSAAQPKT